MGSRSQGGAAARTYFASRPDAGNLDFIDRMENGKAQADIREQTIANTIRGILDDRRGQVQSLGTGKLQSFYENYFPHIWKDPDRAASVFQEWFAKRPLQGSQAFLKQRTLPTIQDGIAAGLEPESTNPIDLVLAKTREMDKYLMAQHALGDLKEQGLVKFVRAGQAAPEGYAKINDRIATVYAPRTEEGAMAIRGEYWAPEPAARILNNYLSPGLRGKEWFRGYMGAANALNQAQLGWSGLPRTRKHQYW